MSSLYQPITLKEKTLSNKICVPPMVCFHWADETGIVSEKHIEHYRSIAKGNPGLLIQEATCVSKDGRLHLSQLGIWDDSQIAGHARISQAVHEAGGTIIMQIHHAGVVGVTEDKVCPSDYTFEFNGEIKKGRALSIAEVEAVKNDFIQAAQRAYQAGYDGVELHGCHNYLLCQFLNNRVNKRTDKYGEPERLIVEILTGIRQTVPADFIVGIRLGGFEPTLADAISHSQKLAAAGIDFLNISYGFRAEETMDIPDDWSLVDIHYSAKKIKENVDIPVFAVFGINSVAKAEEVLLHTGVDMVNIGRGVLVNYRWAADGNEGKDVGRCLYCKTCMWRIDADKCAGRKLLQRRSC